MGTSTPLLVKKAIFTLSKERKLPGSLTVTGSQIQWTPHDPTQCQPHHVDIKGVSDSLQRAKGRPLLRIPTKERPSVFEFESEADRDQAVDIITPLVKSAQKKGKAVANGSVGSPKPASGPHVELKKAVLAADRDLKALHEQLVVGGIISEAEFWRHRQHLLRQQAQDRMQSKQKPGLSNAMIDQSIDPSSNKVTLKLTPEVMQQIFQEKPHTKRAHNKLVPHTHSEKEFWEKLFNYEVQKKGRRGNKKGGAELVDPYEEFKDEHLDAAEARAKLHTINAAVNLAADLFDHGTEPQEKEEEGARQTINDINKHAAAVMRAAGDASRSAAQDSAGRPGFNAASMADQALDDLRQPELAGFSHLRIQDPKRLHDSAAPQLRRQLPQHDSSAASPLTEKDAIAAVEALLKDGAGAHPVPSQAAYAVLVELCRQSSTASAGMHALAAGAKGAEQSLVPRMQEVLRQTVSACNELLRHFWTQFPLTTSKREARALDLKRALINQHDRTTAMQEAAQGLDRVHISQLLKPLRQALDAAIIKHENETVFKAQPVMSQ